MRLEFDEPTHTYRIDGSVVPSVTQLLKPLENFVGIPPDRLEVARQFGDHIHKAINLHNRGDLDVGQLDAPLLPYIQAYIKFLDDTGATVVGSEVMVSSPTYGYAGQVDLDLIVRRKRWTVDVKSSDDVPDTVGPQTAAYDRAIVETFGERRTHRRRACLHLKRSDYRWYELTDPTDWSTFLSCRNIYVWRQRNAA